MTLPYPILIPTLYRTPNGTLGPHGGHLLRFPV